MLITISALVLADSIITYIEFNQNLKIRTICEHPFMASCDQLKFAMDYCPKRAERYYSMFNCSFGNKN